MKTSDFDYQLPSQLIAQVPIEPRDASRLLVLHRDNGTVEHRQFRDLAQYLTSGDVLVGNDSRVIPARLTAYKEPSGGKVELLLLSRTGESEQHVKLDASRRSAEIWQALVKPARRLRLGVIFVVYGKGSGGEIESANPLRGQIVAEGEGGLRSIRFESEGNVRDLLFSRGAVPLPPYIHSPLVDAERYQTIYASAEGSAAAPTAGLHFTIDVMRDLRDKGIEFAFTTLHIGLDTFRPVSTEYLADHKMHSEIAVLSPDLSERLNEVKREGRRVIAVGTTAVRALETATISHGVLRPFSGPTKLFIYPGYRFNAVDGLLTNFHLPRSSLLMLVSALAGREMVINAYREAVREEYRFYSFGDAMLVI